MIIATPFWGIIQMLVMLIFSVIGFPLAFALGVVSFLTAYFYYGGLTGINIVGVTAWTWGNHFGTTMIPLFIAMGIVVAHAGMGRDLYDCFYKWLSGLKGGLAIVTSFACAAFGTVTGSPAAAIAAVGGIAMPEMKRRGYSAPLRTGSACCSGVLANLIPPSIMAIFIAILTETSVGKLFIAGIVPGVILTIFIAATTYIWVSLRPGIAPMVKENFTLKEKLISLQLPVPVAVIFILMIGGIYNGFFSPTEGGAVGLLLTVIITLIWRRLTWKIYVSAMTETVRITAFIMLLVMGAQVFGNTLSLTRLPNVVADYMSALPVGPQGIVLVIAVFLLILGCVLEGAPIVIIFTPLLVPTILAAGYTTIWFSPFMVVLMGMAGITPPIAMTLYLTKAIEGTVTTTEIIKGTLPYYAASLILLVLMIYFPGINTWLPATMMGA